MVVVDLVRNVKGNKFAYERLMPTVVGEAVVVVPKFKDKFILLDHFRHALRCSQLSFPRGYGESGVSAIDNAKKELSEELKIDINKISNSKVIGSVVANSGISGEEVNVVLCEIEDYNLVVGNEEIEGVISLTRDEFYKYIKCGLIMDGFTLSAWSIYNSSLN